MDPLDLFHEISECLAAERTDGQDITEVLARLRGGLGVIRPTVMLLSVDGERLVFDGTDGTDGAAGAAGKDGSGVVYRRGEGIVGRVLEEGQTVTIADIASEPAFRNRIHRRTEAEARGTGFACVPIQVGRRIIGTLSADVPSDQEWPLLECARILRVVASMIAHHVHMRRAASMERQVLEEENLRLRAQIAETRPPGNMIWASDGMRSLALRIRQVARSDTTVLIRGESGTGKELIASAIHAESDRAGKPFVKLNCAALSENLLESELFGHEKGAFTGAVRERIGRLEAAEGGTLFLDEIGEFTSAIQVKLLRVLQEKEYSRVGCNTVRQADIRFVVATNRDLEEAVAGGDFRQDFYYRINVFPLIIPPLRDRREDILPLANHFVETYAKKMNKTVGRISTTAIDMLMAYHWPGNVRELENCIEHALLLCDEGTIQGRHLPPTLAMPGGETGAPVGSLVARVESLERDMIMDALKRNGGNVSASARDLGITPRMVRYKLKKLGIDFKHFFKS